MVYSTRCLAFCVSALLAAGYFHSAAAEDAYDADLGWTYMAGSAYWLQADSKRDADDGFGTRGSVGARLPGGLRVELSAFGQQAGRDSGKGDDSTIGFGGDFLLPIASGGSSPYLLAGGGFLKERVQGERNNAGYANVGIGMLIPLTTVLQLRIEGRYVGVYDDFAAGKDEDPLYDLQAGLGLQAELGRPVERRIRDRNGDGVAD